MRSSDNDIGIDLLYGPLVWDQVDDDLYREGDDEIDRRINQFFVGDNLRLDND